MKKCILTAAMAATVFSAAAVLPNRASAMTLTAPAGLASAAADINPVENVWCSWRGCWGGGYGYWAPRPYWGGYYRPYGFYGPYSGFYGPYYGGWRRGWW